MRTYRSWIRRAAVLAAAMLFIASAPARAQQIVSVGATLDMLPGQPLVRGTDTAHDPVRRVYLQVSAYGPVTGRFLNEAGAPVTGMFTISPGSAFAHYPRVVYSPHVNGSGGFLVVWHQGDGPVIGQWPSNVTHARTIAFNGGPVMGADFTIGGSATGNWNEAAPAVAYSTSSQQFLVAWQSVGSYQIDAVRVNVNGQPVSGVFTISDQPARDPGVAWNPNTDEFGVSYGGWDASSATVTVARVRSGDGAVLRRNVIYRANGTFITDIVFNSQFGTFVVAYAAPGPRTTEVNAAGDVVTHGLVAASVGSYDGLSIAYNAVTGTNVMVGHYTKEIGGVLLDGHGAKIGAEQQVTAGGAANGSFYPRISGNTVAGIWHISFSRDFAAAASQVVATSGANQPIDTDGDGVPDNVDACPTVFAQTANGCPGLPPPPPPPPPTGVGDVNGDNKPDVVFEHMTTGMLYSWFLSNSQLIGESLFNPPTVGSTDWLLVSKDDFTGDGKLDFLWQYQPTGELTVWQMNGLVLVQQIPIPVTPGAWRVVSTPDLNHDGYPDILWQKYSDGALYVWFLQRSGNQVVVVTEGAFINGNGQPIAPVGSAWRVVATGDLNGDNYRDLVWQNQSTQVVVAWYLGGANSLTVTNATIQISGAAGPWRVRMLNDMNSDGKIDIVWQNAIGASPLYVWYMNGAGGMQGSGYLGPVVALSPLWRVVGGR